MKGRLQYSHVNTFIDSFNKVIASKYKLLTAPRKMLKPADYKVVNLMKTQETEETKGKLLLIIFFLKGGKRNMFY